MEAYGLEVDLYDPIAEPNEVMDVYKIKLVSKLVKQKYAGIVIAVAHNEFKKIGAKDLRKLLVRKGLIFDVKNIFDRKDVDLRL